MVRVIATEYSVPLHLPVMVALLLVSSLSYSPLLRHTKSLIPFHRYAQCLSLHFCPCIFVSNSGFITEKFKNRDNNNTNYCNYSCVLENVQVHQIDVNTRFLIYLPIRYILNMEEIEQTMADLSSNKTNDTVNCITGGRAACLEEDAASISELTPANGLDTAANIKEERNLADLISTPDKPPRAVFSINHWDSDTSARPKYRTAGDAVQSITSALEDVQLRHSRRRAGANMTDSSHRNAMQPSSTHHHPTARTRSITTYNYATLPSNNTSPYSLDCNDQSECVANTHVGFMNNNQVRSLGRHRSRPMSYCPTIPVFDTSADDSARWSISSSFCGQDVYDTSSLERERESVDSISSRTSGLVRQDSNGGQRALSRKNSTCSNSSGYRDEAFVEEFCARRGSGACSGNSLTSEGDQFSDSLVTFRRGNRFSAREDLRLNRSSVSLEGQIRELKGVFHVEK